MKKIKTLLCILLTLGIALCICVRPDVVLANNHTLHTVTSFGFIDHHARVNVDFMGYEDTLLLRVDVRIEKPGFLIFNEKIVSESYQAEGESYHNEFFYPLHEDGVYICNVTYTVTNGDTEDVISFYETKTYRLSDYTEHTHVWNHTVTEPTCLKGGSDLKFCYCGQSEKTLLAKLAHTPGSKNYNEESDTYITRCQNCHTGLYETPAASSQSVATSGSQSTPSSNTQASSYTFTNTVTSYTGYSQSCAQGKIFGTPCNLSGHCVGGRCTLTGSSCSLYGTGAPTCKNGQIFGTPCNLSGKCVGGSCLLPTNRFGK